MMRDGLTSVASLLQQYEFPIDKSIEKPFQSFVTELNSGFYIAFRGVFNAESRLAIVYTSFSYMGKNNNMRSTS